MSVLFVFRAMIWENASAPVNRDAKLSDIGLYLLVDSSYNSPWQCNLFPEVAHHRRGRSIKSR